MFPDNVFYQVKQIDIECWITQTSHGEKPHIEKSHIDK